MLNKQTWKRILSFSHKLKARLQQLHEHVKLSYVYYGIGHQRATKAR